MNSMVFTAKREYLRWIGYADKMTSKEWHQFCSCLRRNEGSCVFVDCCRPLHTCESRYPEICVISGYEHFYS